MSDENTIGTGDIGRRIGIPNVVTQALLEQLGFRSVGRQRREILWKADDYPRICQKLSEFVFKAAGNDPVSKPPPKEKKPPKDPVGASLAAIPQTRKKPGPKPPVIDDDEL